jgi:hypothetical protein
MALGGRQTARVPDWLEADHFWTRTRMDAQLHTRMDPCTVGVPPKAVGARFEAIQSPSLRFQQSGQGNVTIDLTPSPCYPCCCVNSCLGSEMKLTVKVKPARGLAALVLREVEEVARAQRLFIAPPTWPVRRCESGRCRAELHLACGTSKSPSFREPSTNISSTPPTTLSRRLSKPGILPIDRRFSVTQ